MKRLALILVLILLIAAGGLAAVRHGAKNPDDLGLRELGEGAGQAYVYGYPLVLMDETRRTMLAGRLSGPDLQLNRLTSIRALPEAGDDTVVRPNLDTLYALAWLDLSAGPLTLSVPDMGERYFVYQVMDAWTNVVAAPGSRTTGSGPAVFDIVRTGAPVPPGSGAVIEVPTRMAWIIGRIEAAATPQDLARVHALQDGFDLSGPVPPRNGMDQAGEQRPPDTVAALPAGEFFARLDGLLEDNPAPDRDRPMLATLASLGIGPLVSPDTQENRFGWLARLAMARGVAVARSRLSEAIAARAYGPANWRTAVDGMGDYDTDYAMRAGVALIGLGANWPQDAVYPNTDIDADGAALHGDHAYRVRFAPEALPPVRAFWSVTLYDEDGFLPDIAGGRHAITDRDALVYGEDGSLELVVSAQRPAGIPAENWLAAPPGQPFALTARLYWPQDAVLERAWHMPPVERMNASD